MTNTRINHCFAVAQKMKEIVQKTNSYSCTPDEAFLLGLLHDIGYESCDNSAEHARVGGELLKDQGYKYWNEVFFHGIPQNEYSSPELWLLNYADMTTGPTGENLSMQDRIQDIAVRYGEDSPHVKVAREIETMIMQHCINNPI